MQTEQKMGVVFPCWRDGCLTFCFLGLVHSKRHQVVVVGEKGGRTDTHPADSLNKFLSQSEIPLQRECGREDWIQSVLWARRWSWVVTGRALAPDSSLYGWVCGRGRGHTKLVPSSWAQCLCHTSLECCDGGEVARFGSSLTTATELIDKPVFVLLRILRFCLIDILRGGVFKL